MKHIKYFIVTTIYNDNSWLIAQEDNQWCTVCMIREDKVISIVNNYNYTPGLCTDWTKNHGNFTINQINIDQFIADHFSDLL